MPGPRSNAAFYAAPVAEFLAATDDEAYAPLAAPHGYTLAPEQLFAWRLQLPVLRMALEELPEQKDASHHVPKKPGAEATGPTHGISDPAPWIHLEFDIPRLGRRVDAVLVTPACVIPIEFKVGAKKFDQLDYEQAWDYGLDLKNFHAPSHAAAIFPILCATDAPESDPRWKPPHADGVRPPFRSNGQSLSRAIRLALDIRESPERKRWELQQTPATIHPGSPERKRRGLHDGPLTPATWGSGSYSPTPTIIEAARSL